MRQVDAIEQMYQDYKSIVAFRLIYINEAHPIDSAWPMGIAEERNVRQHVNYGERCATAEMLVKDQSLTISTLIDGMDNAVNKAYHAHPDRIFVIRSDGRVAVAAEHGPSGFVPGLAATLAWLAEFKASGIEPRLPPDALAAAQRREDKEPASPDNQR